MNDVARHAVVRAEAVPSERMRILGRGAAHCGCASVEEMPRTTTSFLQAA